MKLKLLAVPLLGLALGVPSTGFAAATTTPSPSPAAPTLSDRWHNMEDDMDRIFHDTMQELHLADSTAQPAFGSSIDVREKNDAYEARIFVPKADAGNVDVTLKDGTLNISAGDKKTGSYQESVQLPGPVQQDKMKIENKDGFLLVTIPKDNTKTAAAPSAATQPADEWDQGIVREMQRMQDRMDQLARDAFPDMTDTTAFTSGQFLDSTVKLDVEKNQYVARFYLPDNNTADVKVNVDSNNQLRLSASSESNKESNEASATESQYSSAHYEEEITLPGPVHADQMKVDRKEGVVTVTLPKA